jgi:hypothetical protein
MGVVLLAAAAGLYFHSKTLNNPSQWRPVETNLPMAVMDRQTQIPEFTAAASGVYLIEIEFQMAGHVQSEFQVVAGRHYILGCKSGILKDPIDCKGQRDLLDVTWTASSGPLIVALGASSDFEGEGSIDDQNQKMTRLIGRFNARKGEPYSLKINLHAAPPDLTGTGTKLMVRPEVVYGDVIIAGFESILMLMLGGGGLALLWRGWARLDHSSDVPVGLDASGADASGPDASGADASGDILCEPPPLPNRHA